MESDDPAARWQRNYEEAEADIEAAEQRIKELTAALRQATHLLDTAPVGKGDAAFAKEAVAEFRALLNERKAS